MDYIDKRNQMEQMHKSIVKRRNVVYGMPQMPQEPLDAEAAPMASGEGEEPDDILDRLTQEQQAVEEKMRREIDELREQQEKNQAEINRILQEKQDLLERTMRNAGRENP